MSYNTDGKTRIRLLRDWRALGSNQLVSNPTEFIERAAYFEAGTVFVDNEHPQAKPGVDEDCIENSDMHGWCFEKTDKSGSRYIRYCNFHGYVLDRWREYPEWFDEVEL